MRIVALLLLGLVVALMASDHPHARPVDPYNPANAVHFPTKENP